MALIVDLDDLSQGALTSPTDAVWGTPTGATVTITSALSGLPTIGAGDFFEVRDHPDDENNGLYVESGGTPSTGSITADKLTGSNPIANGTGQAIRTFGNTTTEKSVHIDLAARNLYLIEQGLLSVDGATGQAVYSFLKRTWKDDNDMNPHPFPMVAVTPEQFEFVDGWNPQDNTGASIRTKKLIRTAGWRELDASDVLLREYAGVITLGTFEDEANDIAYYQIGTNPTLNNTINFDFAGAVNEAIEIYNLITSAVVTPNGFDFVDGGGGNDQITRNDGGSWITDGYVVGGEVVVIDSETPANNGTYTILAVTASTIDIPTASITAGTDDNTARFAFTYRPAVKLFLRIRDGDTNGKTFDNATLTSIGVTALLNQVYRFPLSNATDLKIAETDANIGSNSPYTEILIRYFDQTYSRSGFAPSPATLRSFGIVIDVGTHSVVDGATGAAGLFTTTEGGIVDDGRYEGGTLTIHEGSDAGVYTIDTGAPAVTGTTVTVTTTFPNQPETNLSATIQRASPVVATAEEIYEKIQYLLRQTTDIDSTDQTVIGKVADELLLFVGDTLVTGRIVPSNPNGGGSGVMIEGFDSNDTNRLTFTDNSANEWLFPFVAAGTITFNTNLQNDIGPAKYWMFFEYTERFTNTGFGLSAASGDTATLDSSVTDLTAELSDGDYINLQGFTDPNNNGIWVLTGAPAGAGPWTASVRKWDGLTVSNETAGASISLDKNPLNTPDAIIVQDNSSTPITGTVPGPSVGFDFDYDGNTQGGRTSSTDAAIIIRASGLDLAQPTETPGTLTRTTGLSFSLVAGLERNYSDPA